MRETFVFESRSLAVIFGYSNDRLTAFQGKGPFDFWELLKLDCMFTKPKLNRFHSFNNKISVRKSKRLSHTLA